MNIKKNLYLLIITFIVSCSPTTQSNEEATVNGYKMLLMGNSFFRPYAETLDDMVSYTEIENHDATSVFRGGEDGNPYNFWNDSDTNEHQQIKSVLNQGNIELFGMTSGASNDLDTPDILSGIRNWIQYAIDRNPNISIFLATPTFDFPNGESNGTRPDWNTFASDNGFNSIQEFYDYYVNEMVHKEIVDELRSEFPSTKIFTIPTGWAAKNLALMNLDNELLDDISMFGQKSSSISKQKNDRKMDRPGKGCHELGVDMRGLEAPRGGFWGVFDPRTTDPYLRSSTPMGCATLRPANCTAGVYVKHTVQLSIRSTKKSNKQ